MPMSFLGRSLTCPTEAITVYPEPRYLLMVFALEGDSTITSAFVICIKPNYSSIYPTQGMGSPPCSLQPPAPKLSTVRQPNQTCQESAERGTSCQWSVVSCQWLVGNAAGSR